MPYPRCPPTIPHLVCLSGACLLCTPPLVPPPVSTARWHRWYRRRTSPAPRQCSESSSYGSNELGHRGRPSCACFPIASTPVSAPSQVTVELAAPNDHTTRHVHPGSNMSRFPGPLVSFVLLLPRERPAVLHGSCQVGATEAGLHGASGTPRFDSGVTKHECTLAPSVITSSPEWVRGLEQLCCCLGAGHPLRSTLRGRLHNR